MPLISRASASMGEDIARVNYKYNAHRTVARDPREQASANCCGKCIRVTNEKRGRYAPGGWVYNSMSMSMCMCGVGLACVCVCVCLYGRRYVYVYVCVSVQRHIYDVMKEITRDILCFQHLHNTPRHRNFVKSQSPVT